MMPAARHIIAERLAPLGFVCETIASGPADFRVTNLWANGCSPGQSTPAATKLLVFAGHTDVVPTGPLAAVAQRPVHAHPPRRQAVWPRRRRHENLARRLCRGGRRVLGRPPEHGPVHRLLLTSDEEGPAIDGTVRSAKRCRRAANAGLLHRGRTHLGGAHRRHDQERPPRHPERQAHGQGRAGPHRLPAPGKNPIHLVAPRWPSWWPSNGTEGNAFFPPTTWQISNIHGGTGASNVIPGDGGDRLQLPLFHRVHARGAAAAPGSGAGAPRAGLRAGLDARRPALPDRRPAPWSTRCATPSRPRPASRTVLSTTGGTSDGRFIARSARRSSSSARPTPPSTRSTNTSTWPTSSR